MAMTEFEEFIQEPMVFKINGKPYTVPPVGIVNGLVLAGALAGREEQITDKRPDALWRLVLSSELWDELIEDGVPAVAAARMGMAALADFNNGREVALDVWNSGIDPEARAAQWAATQAATTSSAAANMTPKPASTNGTKTRTRTSRANKASQ